MQPEAEISNEKDIPLYALPGCDHDTVVINLWEVDIENKGIELYKYKQLAQLSVSVPSTIGEVRAEILQLVAPNPNASYIFREKHRYLLGRIMDDNDSLVCTDICLQTLSIERLPSSDEIMIDI